MSESVKNGEKNTKEVFSLPNIFSKKSEFERVADIFNIDSSVLMWAADQGNMVPLTESVWSALQNTNSYTLNKGDHDLAQNHAELAGRDYHEVAEAMHAGVAGNNPISAPIIMKYGNIHHLVSGNTQLMAARCYGVDPKVWMFEVDTQESSAQLTLINGGKA